MTYEERIERLKKRVNYQGSPEYIISTAEEESARDRLTEIRNKYSSEAKQKEQEISSGQYNATAYSAAVKAARIKNNSKITATSSSLTAKNYEQQKEELKNEKKEALGSRISTWFKNIGTHINANATDEEKKKASLNYQNAKNEHQQLSDALDTLKENKWTSSQEKNAQLISSNSELQKLVEQARNAKINADSAQSTSNVFKNYSDPNNPASNLAVQEQQKTYQTAYKKYSDIVSKINDLGYDAESLIDTYTRQKNLEETEQFTGEVSKFADEHPVLASGAYVALNSAQAAALPEIIEKGIESKINDEYIPIDVNSGKFGATNIRDTIAETTSANIEDEVNEKTDSEFLAGASSFLYQTGLSMGDFASLVALPKSVSLAIMGSSAAATTAKDATERGISADDALATATAAAAAEIFFEKFSLEGLQALKASGKTGIKNAVKDILKQSFTEGSEEFFTDISNAITDQIINGSDSALSQQYKSLIENGATSTEAKKQVAVDFGKQLGQSFLGGAISGGVMGSGATLLNNIEANSAYRAEGAAIKNMGTDAVTAVINEGLAQKNTSPAYKAASDMLTKNAETDTFEANLDVSNKKLGQLQQLNVQANDISEFSKAVSNEHNAKSLVDTFSKIAQGENISNKEASEILSNKTARQALGNITDIDYIDNGNISSKKLINEVSKAYRASSMGTFSAATPIISSEKARNYINNGISYSHRIGAETKSDTIDKNIVLADGSSDVINSIDSVHNGKVYVKTSAGQVLSADDIRFNDITSEELYKSARVYGNTKTAKAYVFAYNDSTYNGSAADYNAGFNAVYKAQKLGKTFQQAYNYAIESGSHITELQAQTAYEAALTEDDTNISGSSNETVIFDEAKSAKFNRALKSRTKAGATVIAENEITEYQQAEISLINEYAKSINKEVIVVDDTEEIGRPSSNGFYENGKIVLALNNSGNMLSAYFGHELFHNVKQSNPTQAKELQDYIINRLKEKESYNYEKRFASLVDLYKENLERKTDTEIEEYINEEISANACFTVLSDEDNFVNLVKENKSLAQKVRDFFADFIQTIRNALVKISKSNPEYRALEGDIEAKQKILEMFDSALNSKQKNNTTDNGSVKYSIVELEDGTSYVKANRKVITGTTVAEMRKDITSFFNEILKDGDLNVTTSDSNVITINKKTAKKSRDNYVSIKGKARKLSDNEFKIKLDAEAHIDELAEISTFSHSANDNKNHSFAKNRFDYYKTYFQDFDGAYYEITLSVGVNDDIATIYNVGRISKGDLPSAKILAVRGSKALGKSPINSISDLLDYVNKYYPDILPEDVLRHYGYSSRPGGTIGESALYSLKEKYFYSNILKDNADVEEFDETGYNIINTTGKKGYSKIKSEIMTWDADRHLNEIRCGYLGGSFIIYKMLDTDSRDIILYRPKSAFAKTEYAKIRRQYNDNGRKFARPDDVVKVIRNKRNGSNDNNSLSGQKSGEYRENDKLHNSTVREKGHSDGRRNAENGNNDNLSKGRYSLKEKYYDSNILNENVDVEEFDETGYSIINTTGKKGYSKLKSEVMTWDGDRYLDEIRLIRIDDRFYIYKMLSDDTRDVIIYKPRSNQAKELYKEMRENYVVRNYRRPVDAIEIVRIKHGHGNGNNVLFRRQPGESKSDDKFHNSQIRGKRHGDGRRDAENDHNDNLQKGRYSLKDEYFDSNILKENEELKEAADDVLKMLQLVSTENSELRKAFDIRTVRSVEDSSVAKVAAFLKKQYDSTYKKSDLVSNLAGLYNYISNAGEDIDNEYIWRTAKDISANILANTYFKDTTMYDDSKQLRDYIRSQTIRVSDSVKNDITDYNAFRKRNFGRMRLSSDSGIPLDTIYRELSSENPEFFPPDAVLSEQLENIENFFVSTAPVYYNGAEMIAEGNGLSLDEYSNIVASDIFDQYFNVPEVKSFVSEKNIQELNELQKSYETQIEDMRSIYRERYEEQLRSLREENQQRIDKLKEQNDKTLSRLTEKHLDEMAKQKAHFKDISKRGTQRRNASKLRESIRRSLKKIAKLGASADKKNHIPNSIIASVKSLADVINLDNTKKDELISVRLNRIKTSFDTAKNNSEYTDISEAYNDFIENEIIELQAKTEGKTLKQLTNDDLESIDRVLKATVKTISNINKLFMKGRTDTVNNYANSVKSELSAYGKEKIFDGVLRSFAYNSMKPEYFFEYLGSDTLLELYNDLRNGEDTWAVDVNEAKNKADKIRKKYDWNNWRDETLTFSTISGDIELDLQERLAIYANSLGEHTKNHLLGGGFKYQPKKPHGLEKLKKQKNDNQAHKLSEEDVITIVDTLTDEQTSYVKEMIEYMSTEMARKGNDVSKELYDVELFKEATYYPAKVDRESIVVSSKEVRPEKQIKNAGFTNAAVVNAKQPIILMNFDDVWATHIDEMAKYHAFVLPLDNFDRVFNSYQVVDDKYESVKEFIKNSFGSKAVNYIDDLIRDINGGIIQETGVDIISKLTGLFKKNAVFASMSVVVQQPSAIGRALSEIDTKYLAKSTGKGFDRKLYEEMKRYAPVAQIKEMGYFDTNMAQSTVEFLNSRNYETVKEKVSAFVKDGSFRDDALSFFASKVDEITWTQIWQAVKCETENKYPGLSKEDNFKTAGKRFTEIITKTQVYDSVFSRSGLMRSRDLAVKNAMAFMAEPTTALNMFTNAIVQVKRGKMSKTHGAKVLGSLVASSVLNSLLQSIVTSARNVETDDDKEWAEIYLAHLLPNFIENVNPLNQIAFVKDIVNIFKGYDVERADMNLFSDFVDAFRKLNNDKVSVEDKITGFSGAISAFLGIPLKNIIRDVKASFNTAESLLNGVKFNSTESYEVFEEEMNSILGFELFKPDFDKAVRAIKKGNYSDYEKYAENVYGSSQAYDLLYEVLKKYGYNSIEYQKAESLCISVKKENGVANPNPLNSIKNKCIKEYSGLKRNGTYVKAEEARQRCIQVYGSADDVAKALEKYEKSNKN